MKVIELKKILDNFHDDTLVMINGYEGGLEDVDEENIDEVYVSLYTECTKEEWENNVREMFGPHEFNVMGGGDDLTAVVIGRSSW